MYRVLITDDGPQTREYLSTGINWEELGMTVIAYVDTRFETIDIVKNEKPDICIVNIDNPATDGFELIQKIRAVRVETVNIIISGRESLADARRAVRLRVYGYLKMPEDSAELMRLLSDIRRELDANASQRLRVQVAAAIFNENKQTLQSLFLNQWLSGEKHGDDIKTVLSFFNLNFHDYIGILLIKANIDYPVDIHNTETDKKALVDQLHNIVDEVTPAAGSYVIFPNDAGNVILLMNVHTYVEWDALRKATEAQIGTRTGQKVSVYNTLVHDGLDNVPDSYKTLRKNINSDGMFIPIVKKIKLYIESNIGNSQLRLQTFAEENQMSLSYLSKLFKQQTGESFIDYLIRYRITTSLSLLDNSSLKICRIAEMVGYSSQHYYCEAFKKVMGISPSAYRKRGSNGNDTESALWG